MRLRPERRVFSLNYKRDLLGIGIGVEFDSTVVKEHTASACSFIFH